MERRLLPLGQGIDVGLVLEEKHDDVNVSSASRNVQWRPVGRVRPINVAPERMEIFGELDLALGAGPMEMRSCEYQKKRERLSASTRTISLAVSGCTSLNLKAGSVRMWVTSLSSSDFVSSTIVSCFVCV